MKITHLTLGVLIASGVLLTSCLQQPASNANTNSNTTAAKVTNTLTLSKTTYAPGEEIAVAFQTDQLDKTAWVGIIPSSTPHGSETTNDAADIAYKYLDGTNSGVLMMEAPVEPGSYDFRLNESDAGGKELASVSFVVKAEPVTGSGAKITLGKNTYKPGEQLSASFQVPAALAKTAWIGVIPSETPHGTEEGNDAADLSYVYLNGQSVGPVRLWAPEKTGSYDLRLNENESGGKELTSVTFTVAE